MSPPIDAPSFTAQLASGVTAAYRASKLERRVAELERERDVRESGVCVSLDRLYDAIVQRDQIIKDAFAQRDRIYQRKARSS